MMMSPETAAENPLNTDEEILERVDALVGSACSRQLWMMFLTAEGSQLPLLIPLADYPAGPGGGAAENLATSIAAAASTVGAAQVLLVWERRLGEASVPADRLWAKQLHAACAQAGLDVRAQLISHAGGVRMLHESEYR